MIRLKTSQVDHFFLSKLTPVLCTAGRSDSVGAAAGIVDTAPSVLPVRWRDSVARSGEVPQAVLDALYLCLVHRSQTVLAIGWLDADGCPDLASAGTPECNSWRNHETRVAFVNMVVEVVRMTRPEQICIALGFEGVCRESKWLRANLSEWLAWLSVVDSVRKGVSAVPETRVVTVP